MQMQTEGNMIRITLDEGDTYEGGEPHSNGASLHKFILSTLQPLVIIRNFTQIMEIETHDGWELDQRADGKIIMGPSIDLWKTRMDEGMSLTEARAWQDYPSRSVPEPIN